MTRLGIFLLGMLVLPWAWADFTVDYRVARTSTERTTADVQKLEIPSWPLSLVADRQDKQREKTSSGHLDVYFGRVDTSNVPLSEAGFISKRSKFHLDAYATESDYESSAVFTENGVEVDSDYASVDGSEISLDTDLEFITGGFPLIFGFGTSFGFGEQEFSGVNYRPDEESEEFAWRAKVGLYFSDKGRITYGYEKRTFENIDTSGEVETSTRTVSVKQIFSLPGKQFLSAQARYEKASVDTEVSFDSKALGAQLVYYPIHRLGLGLGRTKFKDKDPSVFYGDTTGTNYFVEFFFSEYVGLHLRYAQSDASESSAENSPSAFYTSHQSGDADSLSLEFNARF